MQQEEWARERERKRTNERWGPLKELITLLGPPSSSLDPLDVLHHSIVPVVLHDCPGRIEYKVDNDFLLDDVSSLSLSDNSLRSNVDTMTLVRLLLYSISLVVLVTTLFAIRLVYVLERVHASSSASSSSSSTRILDDARRHDEHVSIAIFLGSGKTCFSPFRSVNPLMRGGVFVRNNQGVTRQR